MTTINHAPMWRTIEHPGYFGKKRLELETQWNTEHGHKNWRLAWQFGELALDFPAACHVYARAYHEYLRFQPVELSFIAQYQDVEDTAPSNVLSGLDFMVQETPNNHIHDIAIRWSLAYEGLAFTSTIPRLLKIRGEGTEGERFSPHHIPFHQPSRITKVPIADYGKKGEWWRELGITHSVEEWYQRNKQLQVRTQ